jgi:hypothetical protein
MPKWSGDFKRAEAVYTNNEYNTFMGRYPVGKNGFWHSGMNSIPAKQTSTGSKKMYRNHRRGIEER